MDKFLDTIYATNNETRVQILAFLQKHGRTCVCEFEVALNLAQARLSTNLTILKKAGFLNVEREGKWAYYKLSPKTSLHVKILEEIGLLDLYIPPKTNVCDMKEKI